MTATAVVAGRNDRWWLPLLEGILAIILGIFFLTSPVTTSLWFVLGLGVYWLVLGLVDIVRFFREGGGWTLFSGIVGILAGLLIMSGMLGQSHPLGTAFAIGSVFTITLAFGAIIYGVIGIVQAFKGGGWWPAVLGGFGLFFGIVMLMNPLAATLSLPWSLGIVLIVIGTFLCVAAFRMR